MYLNRIFAAIVFRLEPQFRYLTYKDFKNGVTIRSLIATVLRQYAQMIILTLVI